MNEPSPYQPPLPQEPVPFPLPGNTVPAAVNVFGVLHLVFAGIGILFALWGLVSALVFNPWVASVGHDPQVSQSLEAQRAMQAKIMPMSIASGVLSLLVAVPMIIAGLKLIKKRRSGLTWSNRYAISSLVAKFVNLILTLTILVPAMQEMSRQIFSQSKVPDSATDIMSGFMVGGSIGGVVITCAYPIVTLILLNRPHVKEWFARHGS